MARRPHALPLIGAALVAAGCGSTTVRHVTRTIVRPAPASTTATTATPGTTPQTAPGTTTETAPTTTTTSTATSTTAAPGPRGGSRVAGRSPRAIVDAAAHALRTAGGYSMRADLRQGGVRTVVALTADGPHTFQATLTDRGSVTGLITLPSASYLRGNRVFWSGQVGRRPGRDARAARLAGHWLKLTARGASSLVGSLGSLAPSVVARCLIEDHGTLTLAGQTTIGHTRAVIVKDAGDAPGATPSTITVAAAGPPYPLRYTATGRTRGGGRVDVCNTGRGADSEGTIVFNQFGQVPRIRAPSRAGSAGGAPV